MRRRVESGGRMQARRVEDGVEVWSMTFTETDASGVVAKALCQGHV